MWDIYALRSSTGGYPWTIDGKSSTFVYIKNAADHAQQYFLDVKYNGGVYAIGNKTIGAGQTVTYDLRELRDDQIRDNRGRLIPLNVNSGQVHWSKVGGEAGVLIGRSEQVDVALGISSNYACINCCGDNPDQSSFQVVPGSWTAFVNDSVYFTATVQYQDCYGGTSPPTDVSDAEWTSDNIEVADVGAGVALAQAPGTAHIKARWQTQRYYSTGDGGGGGLDGGGGGGGSCNSFNVTYDATPATFAVFAVNIESDVISVQPSGTAGTNTATIKVVTEPPWPNQSVSLTLSGGTSLGGHVSHSGTRPLGTLAGTQGTTNAQGIFQTTYTSPIFSGSVIISSTLNGHPAANSLEVLVLIDGLSELGASADYSLVGQLPTHPSNHWGTATALTNLPLIAGDYLNQFPGADILHYNDMSLVYGGKFDWEGSNWCSSCAHAEHRIGINCDVYSGNVPTSRWSALTRIFQLRGSPNYGDETASANHWHLRFDQ